MLYFLIEFNYWCIEVEIYKPVIWEKPCRTDRGGTVSFERLVKLGRKTGELEVVGTGKTVLVAGGKRCVDMGKRGPATRGEKGFDTGLGRGLLGAAGLNRGSGSRTISLPSFPSVCNKFTSNGLARDTVVSAGADVTGALVFGATDGAPTWDG